MKILVCGGAGYIGSHMVRYLHRAGEDVVVFDNLSTGHAWSVKDVPLVVGDIRDAAAMDKILADGAFDAVIHMCASSLVGESVTDPYKYYDNNVAGTLSLLQSMRRHGVAKIVFSSTAAVFGIPQAEVIDEEHPTQPINPYGASKLMVERMLADAASAYGVRSVSLRYFNAAGADPEGGIGEAHEPETHLIPNVLRAALGKGEVKIFGDDYDTADGTCVRDYIHVNDLADAHLKAIHYMLKHEGAHRFNLGNGHGFSVKDIIRASSEVSGKPIPMKVAARRPGDPATLVASSAKARSQLGWQPVFTSIDAIIESAWTWHNSHN